MKNESKKLKEAFMSEAEAHVKTMNKSLVEFEKSPDDKQLFHDIFRSAHTLKSLAATMNYRQMMALCHALEDLLDGIRNNSMNIDYISDLLFKCFDYLSADLKVLDEDKAELDADHLLTAIKECLEGGHPSTEAVNTDYVPPEAAVHEKIQSIDVKVERLDTLMNLAEALLVNKMKFDILREEYDHPELTPAIESLGRLISDLQYHVLQVRLVPLSFVFTRYIRMVRDLAKQQNKKINLMISGSDIELDRLLIDELGASIAHLIRNAIDHGIESKEERIKNNKSELATLRLHASRSKETAVIEVSDDGAGLDLDVIENIALKNNIINGGHSKQDIINAIFSGISTTKEVTPLSGRGLGLSIVKQKIESVGGSIKVKTTLGQGTSFIMELPLTLAIIRTLFVKVANEIYAIPIESVERLVVVEPHEFKGMLDMETILYQEDDVPIIRLASIFGLNQTRTGKQSIVIIHKGEARLGLVVDSLLSTQEVVIKPLARTIKDNKYFSGAAVIGTGQMVLILDVAYFLSIPQREVKQLA